jgi:hypothetical protein
MSKVQLGKDITAGQADSIVDFMKSLTGEMPKDVLTVPVLPALN